MSQLSPSIDMTGIKLSQRIHKVQDSIIPLINQLVLKHPGTISLGQGVAYYGPPRETYVEINKHLASSKLDLYGPVEGIPELLESISAKLAKRNSITVNSKNRIFVTAGSNMAFSSLIPVIADPGDEIILLTPYYFNHDMAVKLADAVPVLVPTSENYHPDIEKIKSAITDKTRAVVTISPNNPSAAVYTREELTEINQLCARHGIFHISDEAYEDFVYDSHSHFSAASIPGSEAHTISLYSLSKAYGFAGWRVGYMVIPEHIFTSVKKVQDTILISPPIISQYAALGALSTPYSYIQEKIEPIKQSRSICLDALNSSNILQAPATSEGAFYIFARLKTQHDDFELAKELVKQHGIATIPGDAFAATDGTHLRISYGALVGESIKTGINKLITGCESFTHLLS